LHIKTTLYNNHKRFKLNKAWHKILFEIESTTSAFHPNFTNDKLNLFHKTLLIFEVILNLTQNDFQFIEQIKNLKVLTKGCLINNLDQAFSTHKE
jgi:hypothetical protein